MISKINKMTPKMKRRTFIFLSLILSSAGVTIFYHLFFERSKDEPTTLDDIFTDLIPGYQLRKALFFAVPNEEALKNELYTIPLLGNYFTNFNNLAVVEHSPNNRPFYSVDPVLGDTVGNFTPIMRLSGQGTRIEKSIDITRISANEIKIDGLGSIGLDFGANKTIKLNNTIEARIEMGDFDFISKLAQISSPKEHRVYFIERMYISDVFNEIQGGISATLKVDKSEPNSLGLRFKDYFEGTRVVLGCKFNFINSSLLLPEISSANKQELLARDLQRVLGMNQSEASDLSHEPLIYQISGNKVQILFISPFVQSPNDQLIQSDEESKNSNKIEVDLSPILKELKYTVSVGNRAYTIKAIVQIREDLSVNIDPSKYQWAAIRWESFNVKDEFIYRNRATLEEIIVRIDSLREELFDDAVRKSSPLNSSFEDSQNLADLLETAPAKRLKIELGRIPPNADLTAQEELRKNLAERLLNYLKDNKLPSEEEVKPYEDQAEESAGMLAIVRWMQGDDKIRLGQLEEAADLFKIAAGLLPEGEITSDLLNERAIAAYISAATRKAEEVQTELEKAQNADDNISSFTHLLAAKRYREDAEKIQKKGEKLFTDSNRSRTELDWKGYPDISGIPYPWQRTDYLPGDEPSKFRVTQQKNGYVEAINGSIQISALVNVDLEKYNYIAWDWKAIDLPIDGDLRFDNKDDQAIQVIVIFESELKSESSNIIGTKLDALDYVWDTNAPIGEDHRRRVGIEPFSYILNYLVVETGTEYKDKWRPVRRNLVEDFQKVFHNQELPKRVKSVTVQTNSWRTQTKSAGEVSQIRFTKDPLSEEELH